MNIIFLTISRVPDVSARGIYTDLLRKFRDEGHNVYVVYPRERQFRLPTALEEQAGVHLLGVHTLNIQKTNVVEKGLATLLVEGQYRQAIDRHLRGVSFDLILYSTPPITFTNVVRHLKRLNPQAVAYLLLKDIFPQNAVDLGMLARGGLLHRYFRRKEQGLYRVSDFIGCMSPANVDFVLRHNPEVPKGKVEVAPNSIEPLEGGEVGSEERQAIRRKYRLPVDKLVFVYGGNLGKPQGVGFLMACLERNKDRADCFFLVVGNGTEYHKLEAWFAGQKPRNALLLSRLPKADYDLLVRSCDVGLIFLDHRFTIPNYPSRLLSYLECRMPVLAATDEATDVGRMAEENGYGLWCRSNDAGAFTACVDRLVASPGLVRTMGERGYAYLKANYVVDNTYSAIMSHF